MDYLKRAFELHEQMIADRRTIHRHPETGLEVPVTSGFIKSRLAQMGIESKNCGQFGLYALIGNKQPGPVILLRAEMDALPMEEESGLPFASEIPGKAHCCGHDNNAVMLLAAAQMLKETEDELPGTVKVMFQPGEEIGAGCREMLENGILDDPVPQAAIGLHVDASSPLALINWGMGPVFCSTDAFNITVKGKSCHGARPHQGKDAINCAAHIIISLETLIAREADPEETNMLTVCSIESNSKVFNSFPDSVELKGSLRSYSASERAYLKKRICEVCEGNASTFGCTVDIQFGSEMDVVVLNDELEKEVTDCLKRTFGNEARFAEKPIRKMGSDDFCNITSRIPTAYFFVGAGIDRNTPYPYGQHNSKVVFNEDALPFGAAGLAACAREWLNTHSGE